VEQVSPIDLAAGSPEMLQQAACKCSRPSLSQAQALAKTMSRKLQSFESSNTYKVQAASHSYEADTKLQYQGKSVCALAQW